MLFQRLRQTCAAALLLSLAAPLGSAAGSEVGIHSRGNVDARGVFLSDLFQNLETAGDAWVETAPAPGQSMIISANRLADIARTHGLEWRPRNGRQQVVIERPGQRIPRKLIDTHLAAELTPQIGGDGVEIDYLGGAPEIFIDPTMPLEIAVEDINLGSDRRRFSARLAVPAVTGGVRYVDISGRVHGTVRVPVPARHLRRSEIISERDVIWKQTRMTAQSHMLIDNLKDLLDQSPRRMLAAGKPIRRTDIIPVMLVQKGDQILISLSSGALMLSTRAIALESGARGETIRVRNLNSRKVIEVTVTTAGGGEIKPLHLAARS